MVNHTCNRCNKNFSQKSSLTAHMKNKKICEINDNNITNENIVDKMKLLFAEHQKIIQDYQTLNNNHNELKIKCEKLESQLQIVLTNQQNKSTKNAKKNYIAGGENNTINDYSIIDESTNIIVINFSDSKEHYKLEDKDMKHVLNSGLKSVIELFKLTRFNPNNTHLHNAVIQSWKDKKYCESLENNTWDKTRTNHIISALLDDGVKILSDVYKNDKELGRDKKIRRGMEHFIAYNDHPEDYKPHADQFQKEMYDDLVLELYKARKYIKTK